MLHSSADPTKGAPPLVEFEYRPVEDVEASRKAGRRILKDRIWARIQIPQSHDVLEMDAEEWVKRKEEDAQYGRFPRQWAEGFREYLDDWKKRHEAPAEGFFIRHWPAVDRSTAEMLLDARISTVEQLAAAKDAQLAEFPDGKQLRELAKGWLTDAGKAAAEIAQLKGDLETMILRNRELQSKVQELEALLTEATAPEKRIRAVKA